MSDKKEYDFFAQKPVSTPVPKISKPIVTLKQLLEASLVTVIGAGTIFLIVAGYHKINPYVDVLDKTELTSFVAKYNSTMLNTHIKKIKIERNKNNIYSIKYLLDNNENIYSFNYTSEANTLPAYTLTILNDGERINYVEHNLEKVDILNSEQVDKDIKTGLLEAQKYETKREQAIKTQQDEENKQSIADTQKLWGDLYEPAQNILIHYQLTKLDIQKNDKNYEVFSRFQSGSELSRTYDFTYADTVNIMPATYSLSLRLVTDAQGQKHMISEGFSTMQKNLSLDLTRAKNDFMPELAFAASRARQSQMWEELNAYTEASYDKNRLKAFINARPYAEDMQKLINRLISDMDDKTSIYQENRNNAITMLNYAAEYNLKIDTKRVCNAYNKMSDKLLKTDKMFFQKALNGASPESVCQ